MKWTERRDLKDFSGRIIKDEPNYWITVSFTPIRDEMRVELCMFEAVHSMLKDLLCAFSPRTVRNKPIARKLCNHRSLLLLFPRLWIGLKGEKRRAECRSSPCCVYRKVQKNLQLVSEWKFHPNSSLKSELRVAVVREIYGLKFIYNFS